MLKVAHSFLVHPGKNVAKANDISGTEVQSKELLTILENIYNRAEDECKTMISFCPNELGEQKNAARDLIVAYLKAPTKEAGKKLAIKLQAATTQKPGLGLMFILAGKVGKEHKIVVSRFPAKHGFLADENLEKLSVKFLNRVFMKSETAYKAALYKHASLDGFSSGHVIDRQINAKLEVRQYWIRDFLDSELAVTSAHGSRRLAVAFKQAIDKSPDLSIKEELVSATRLMRGHKGKTLSGASAAKKLGLSEEATTILKKQMRNDTYSEQFEFDPDEFLTAVGYKLTALENGAIVSAPADRYEEIVEKQTIKGDKVRLSVEGRVSTVKFRKIQ